ncbi:MAG: CpsD/CapB family tyrosine-protein kinase [Alicyclobacillus sp.]|nr:CpsD/CapB family tyrosine-protein kinase [Alicyclobacillus sp.]
MAPTQPGGLPVSAVRARSLAAEAYRTVRTNIQFFRAVGDLQVIQFTSTFPSEGKTSTACNVAVVSAQAGVRVLLVDADLRKPQVHQQFQISNLDGLSTLLIREKTAEACVVASRVPGLNVLPSGPIPPNPSEMLSSKAFQEFIHWARSQYELVVVDSAPVLSVADALVLSQVADGVVFVVDAQSSHRVHARRAVEMLRQVNAKLLGAVLNRVERAQQGYGYYYSYYYQSSNEQASV